MIPLPDMRFCKARPNMRVEQPYRLRTIPHGWREGDMAGITGRHNGLPYGRTLRPPRSSTGDGIRRALMNRNPFGLGRCTAPITDV